MRRAVLALILGALALSPSLPRATAQEQPAQPAAPAADATAQLQALSWMAGLWRGEAEGGVFETFYTSPEGGQILSLTKSISGGKVDFFEFERIDAQEGAVVLSPYPMGDAGATFRLVSFDPAVKKAVFSSPQNDFPSQLTFEAKGTDQLVILIAGMQDGQRAVMKLELRKR